MTRFCSIFNQLLQLFPRTDFQRAVQATQAERHARGFACWDQFVAMLFAQLGRAHSLREICGGLASCEGKLAHLGAAAPHRSTLAYANAHRPWSLYQTVFYQVLARCREVAGAKPFRFKNKLLSLDATVIDLCVIQPIEELILSHRYGCDVCPVGVPSHVCRRLKAKYKPMTGPPRPVGGPESFSSRSL